MFLGGFTAASQGHHFYTARNFQNELFGNKYACFANQNGEEVSYILLKI